MSNSELDLQAIREKLRFQQRPPQQVPDSEANLIDWESPSRSSQGASLAQLNGAVAALQQRSTARQQSSFSQDTHTTHSHQSYEQLLKQLRLHRERLQKKAEEINSLSLQQERAMLEMKEVVERWERELSSHMRTAPEATRLALEPLASEFLMDYESAVIGWTEIEANGGIFLAYRPVDFYQANREANQIAQSLRTQSFGHSSPVVSSWQEWQTLWAEPWEGLRSGWTWLESALSHWWQTAVGSLSPRRSSRLSLMDTIIWLGGGIFSRVILDFVLAIYPGLWSVAVAVVTAMTAYALYRATLAPKLDFGLAYRVLLAVAGLIIGGRL